MDYIDSNYVIRNNNHILKFFEEVRKLEERYEDLAENTDNPRFKIIPPNVIKCEYLSNGVWTKSN